MTNRFCQLWTVSGGVPTRMREFATREEAVAAAEVDIAARMEEKRKT